MSQPRSKRLKTSFPICRTHKPHDSGPVKQNFPAVVEESLCGITSLLMEVAYILKALATIFEQDDVALPRVAGFFHKESEKEQEQAEAMLAYLAERGGSHCFRGIQKPGCEGVHAILPALEITLARWKELLAFMMELSQLAMKHGDPLTSSTINGRFLAPLVHKVKTTGSLLTSARRLGCDKDGQRRFGEYLMDQLQEEFSSI